MATLQHRERCSVHGRRRRRARALVVAMALGAATVQAGSPSPAAATTSPVPAAYESAFMPVGPARLADTRPTGRTVDGVAQATGRRAPGTTLGIPVLGRARIPTSGVGAVVLHVAAVSPSTSGYLTAFPCGTARPSTATVNFERGRTIQNLAIVRTGNLGAVCVYSSAAADLVVDVSSWTRTVSTVVPVTPARLADTRPTGVTVDGVAKSLGRRAAASTFVLPVLGRASVPTTAVGSVVLHVAAVAPSTSGYLTAWACGTVRPTVASVRFAAGQTVQSLAVVAPGLRGNICVYSSAATDIVVDVTAWTRRGIGVIPLPPARLADTAPTGHTVDGAAQGGGPQAAGTVVWVPLGGRGGLPYSPRSVVVNITAASPAADGYLTAYPCDAARPAAATVNFVRGRTIQNTEVLAPSQFSGICVYVSAPTNVIVDVVAWGAPEPPNGVYAALAGLPRTASLTTYLYDGGTISFPQAAAMWRTPTGAIRLAVVDREARTVTIRTFTATTFVEQPPATVLTYANWSLFVGLYVAPTGDLYLAVGRPNPTESDAVIVLEVRRYNSALHYYGAAHIRGGVVQGGIKGISTPFTSASDMLLVGDRLVVHCSRIIYGTPDGLHHQTNFTFEVAVGTMTATSFDTLGGFSGVSYVSHSFRQMLTMANGALVMVDHGDAYPRSITIGVMANYPTQRSVTKYEVFPFNGAIGNNFTGASLTVTVASGAHVLVAGNSIRQPNAPNGVLGSASERRNVFLATLDTGTGAHGITWLTAFAPGGTTDAGEPRAVQVAADRFAVLFPVHDATHGWTEYRLVDHAGTVYASARFATVDFAPATAPILVDGRIMWLGPADDLSTGVGYVWVLDVRNPAVPVLAG